MFSNTAVFDIRQPLERVTIWRALQTACMLLLCACQQRPASTALQLPHPDDSSKRVEYFVEQPAGSGPWPTVVLLHGHQDSPRPGGRDFVEWGVLTQLAARGYLAVAVSQPGYGNSSGPADFSGPFTQHAVTAVITALRADGLASLTQLVIEGISRGALTAALVAAQDTTVSGLVLISGVYDLPAYVADTIVGAEKQLVVRALLAESGGSPDALGARSAVQFASAIRAKTLILNGALDDRTDPGQARAFAEAIARSGGTARAIIYPSFGHRLPVDERNKDIDPFIDSLLRTASDSSSSMLVRVERQSSSIRRPRVRSSVMQG